MSSELGLTKPVVKSISFLKEAGGSHVQFLSNGRRYRNQFLKEQNHITKMFKADI